MKETFDKIIAWANDNWAEIVKFVDKIWAFLKETIFKDDSIFGTTAAE